MLLLASPVDIAFILEGSISIGDILEGILYYLSVILVYNAIVYDYNVDVAVKRV